MAVAKSYEKMEIIGEPFEREGKMYVRVKGVCNRCNGSGNYSYNPKDGTTCFRCGGSGKEYHEVRWYTDKQREAMDRAAEKRAAAKVAKVEERKVKFAARNAFGFGEKGYITLVVGDSHTINEWAHETDPCRARFNTIFGWFIPSKMEMPVFPEGVTGVELTWDMVGADDLTMKDNNEVETLVRQLRGEISSNSTHQGTVGEWITANLVVREKYQTDTRYGDKFTHVMIDANGNVFVWATGTKNYDIGTSLSLKMKVKEHSEYKGEKRTVVWYCKEAK